jgi:hypothetical protein
LYRLRFDHPDDPARVAVGQVRDPAAAGDPWAHELNGDGVRHLTQILEAPADDDGIEVRVLRR